MSLTVSAPNLPSKIDDLAKFALVGREKLVAVRAEIRAIDKVGLAEDVRRQKLSEAQDIAEAVLDAEVKLGELMAEIPTESGARTDIEPRNSDVTRFCKEEVLKNAGFNKMQASRFEQLAKNPDIVAKAKAEARENDDIVSRSLVLNMVKSQKKAKDIEAAQESIKAQIADAPEQPIVYVNNGIGFVPDEPYDLLLTDPPYSTDVEDIDAFARSWLPNALSHVKGTGFAYVFIGAYPRELKAYLNIDTPEHIELTQVLVWTYKNTLGNNPRDRYKQNYQACLFYRGIHAPEINCPIINEQWAVQEINAPDGRVGDRYHAWQKPIEIAERFIRHSTRQGQTVFDPFACTGTFLIAAAKLGRKAYGFEINPDNAQIAKDRGCIVNG